MKQLLKTSGINTYMAIKCRFNECIGEDINKLEKALKLIEQTDNYLHFNKSALIFDLCEQINVLKEKAEKQTTFINSLS